MEFFSGVIKVEGLTDLIIRNLATFHYYPFTLEHPKCGYYTGSSLYFKPRIVSKNTPNNRVLKNAC